MFFCFFLSLFFAFSPDLPIIEESCATATFLNDGHIYKEQALKNPLAKVYKNSKCEILEDFSMEIYKVAVGEHIGWVSVENLVFEPQKPTDKSILSKESLEDFVNHKNYTSKTDYLILTEINRQKTYIFHQNNGWKLIKTFDCATGQNTSPTTRGIFEIKDRGESFYSERLKSGALFWLRFNNNYLLHSTPTDKNKNILPEENKVGQAISQGCIRLLLTDIQWIYENIPDKTAIVVI